MQKTQTTCLVILATIAIWFSLASLKSVLLPFVIAVFIVIGCRPILEFIEHKLKLHRFVAFLVTFTLGFATLFGFAILIWISINDLSKNTNTYEERLNTIVTWVIERIPSSSTEDNQKNENEEIEEKTGEPNTEFQIQADPSDSDRATQVPNSTEAIKELQKYVSKYVQTQMMGLASSLSSLLSYSVLILIFVFFLLLGNEGLARRHTRSEGRAAGLVAEIEAQVRKYLLMKTVISILTGFTFGFILWLFGVPLAIVFGFLAFLLNFIPNIGPLISTVLPVPFLILNADMSPTSAVICFCLIATIQFVSGNVIETRIMGKSFDVSPVFLLLALIFFGMIWGIVGMFLATPIVSIIKIVLQQTELGRPVAELMAGRWDV